jgi:hypothetical protein
MKASDDILAFLLALNQKLVAEEANGHQITGPGLPPGIAHPEQFITSDCLRIP